MRARWLTGWAARNSESSEAKAGEGAKAAATPSAPTKGEPETEGQPAAKRAKTEPVSKAGEPSKPRSRLSAPGSHASGAGGGSSKRLLSLSKPHTGPVFLRRCCAGVILLRLGGSRWAGGLRWQMKTPGKNWGGVAQNLQRMMRACAHHQGDATPSDTAMSLRALKRDVSDPEEQNATQRNEETVDNIVANLKKSMESNKITGDKECDVETTSFWAHSLQAHLKAVAYKTAPKLLVLLRKWTLEVDILGRSNVKERRGCFPFLLSEGLVPRASPSVGVPPVPWQAWVCRKR